MAARGVTNTAQGFIKGIGPVDLSRTRPWDTNPKKVEAFDRIVSMIEAKYGYWIFWDTPAECVPLIVNALLKKDTDEIKGENYGT